MRRLLILLSLTLALESAALADEPTAPTASKSSTVPAIGTRFYVSDGGYFEVIATNPPNVTTRTQRGQERTWLGGVVSDIFLKNISIKDRESFKRLQPLSVGRDVLVSFEELTGNSVFRHNVRVLRQESVTTPAGTFDTFVVEWRAEIVWGMTTPPVWINTYWYAPSAHFNVKWTFTSEGSFERPPANNSWVLTKIALPKERSKITQLLDNLWTDLRSGKISQEEFDKKVAALLEEMP